MSRRFVVLSIIFLLSARALFGGGAPVRIDVYWCGDDWGSWINGDNWCTGPDGCSPEPCPPYEWPDNNDTQFFYVSINSSTVGFERVNVFLDGYYTVSEIEFRGDVNLKEPGGLTVVEPNGFVNHDDLRIEIDVHGDIVNKAGSKIHFSGDNDITGNLYNETGSRISLERHELNIHDGAVYNDGHIQLITDASIGEGYLFSNTGTIELFVGHCHGMAFVNWPQGFIKGSGYVTSNEGFWNRGTIEAARGPMLLYVGDGKLVNEGKLINNPGSPLNIMTAEDFNNVGIIEVNQDGAVTVDCNLINEPNGHISILGGTLSADTIVQEDGSVLKGFGGITGDVVIDQNGLIQLTGPTSIVGDVEISPNATLEVSDGTTIITGHTTCNNGTIHMIGGRVICQGGLTNNNCNVIWEPGIHTNMADFNLDGKVNIEDFAYFANVWLWKSEL